MYFWCYWKWHILKMSLHSCLLLVHRKTIFVLIFIILPSNLKKLLFKIIIASFGFSVFTCTLAVPNSTCISSFPVLLSFFFLTVLPRKMVNWFVNNGQLCFIPNFRQKTIIINHDMLFLSIIFIRLRSFLNISNLHEWKFSFTKYLFCLY